MLLGLIAIAGLADCGRTFRDREDIIRYLALNASAEMEDLWVTDDTAWTNAPACHIEFPDMVERRKEQLLAGNGTPRMREGTSAATRTMRCAVLRSISVAYLSTTVHACRLHAMPDKARVLDKAA
jgi:hypothetical protein